MLTHTYTYLLTLTQKRTECGPGQIHKINDDDDEERIFDLGLLNVYVV